MADVPLGSCGDAQPLVKLEDDGEPSRLNYNLPTSTAIRVKGYMPLGIPADWFKDEYRQAPPAEENPWKPIDDSGPGARPSHVGDIEIDVPVAGSRIPDFGPGPVEVDEIITLTPALDRVAKTFRGFDGLSALAQKTVFYSRSAPAAGEERQPVRSTALEYVAKQPTLEEIDSNVAARRLPFLKSTLWGAPAVKYVDEPETAVPRLFIIEHYQIASYLRDYGAGCTIKTFSLLPGEKTTISVRSFRQTTESKSKTENVLDSYSQKSADEFESMLQSEVGTHESSTDKSATAVSYSDTDTYGGGGSVGVNLGIVSVGGGASGSSTSTEKSERTTSSAREAAVDSTNKALDRHVAQSSAAREVEVKTESQQSETAKTEDETTTVRTLENINHSRVLNFVFRQLSQQYVTITYLAEVTVGFANGYPNRTRIERLDNLQGLLEDVLEPEHVDEVRRQLLLEINSITDKDGTVTEFIEKVEEDMIDPDSGESVPRPAYWRRRRDLEQTVEGVTVPGVVLDVAERILRTDAVVVEALLGQGEALDCYNQRLQDAAATRARIENEERAQAIEVIGDLPDAVARAERYKQVFGSCCSTPQAILNGDHHA